MVPKTSALIGRWRIVDTDVWDHDALDLVQPAFIEFRSDLRELGFIAVKGWLDCRYSIVDGNENVDFSWDRNDECDHASGRGSAVLRDDRTLKGQIFFHMMFEKTRQRERAALERSWQAMQRCIREVHTVEEDE